MITMKDIAKAAGVSAQTVSNVINNKKSQISEETKKKILKLIDQFGYRPSRVARNLRRGSTKNIGLVIPDMVYHPFYPKIFDIIENMLGNIGYNISVFNTREDIEKEKKVVNELLENKVDGIVFIRIVQKNEYLKHLPRSVPIVACLRAFEYPSVPSVLTDNKKVGSLATDFLIKNGHKKVIHIAGNEDLLAHRERKLGYLESLEKNNISVNSSYIIHCDYKGDDLHDKIYKVLYRLKGFTAVFAYNDIVAVNCMKAIRRMGYRVPEDISVIGADNLDIGRLVEPALTTIEQPIEEICELSIRLVINLIEKHEDLKNISKQTLLCEPKLIVRDSVKECRRI